MFCAQGASNTQKMYLYGQTAAERRAFYEYHTQGTRARRPLTQATVYLQTSENPLKSSLIGEIRFSTQPNFRGYHPREGGSKKWRQNRRQNYGVPAPKFTGFAPKFSAKIYCVNYGNFCRISSRARRSGMAPGSAVQQTSALNCGTNLCKFGHRPP